MFKKKECVALLLAGGQGSRLHALTAKTAKPAVTFGGKYRIIDFPLSNCVHSGIDTVGVLTQYQPLVLNEYIGTGLPWDLDRNYGGVKILPPYQGKNGADWYKGTANAIYQNLQFIERYNADYVLILSGDHIYRMDYAKMLERHKETGAACTIAVIEVPMKEAGRFGIMTTDETGKILKFAEKPKHPESNKASMGIYIFTRRKLTDYLVADAANPHSQNDFGKNIIPAMLAAGEKMMAYTFSGYWKDVGTIRSLWEANMDILGEEPVLNLGAGKWRILSRHDDAPPQYIGPEAVVENTSVTEGCEIFGTVKNSVLGENVRVEAGATVEDSVLMGDSVVKAGARVDYAILDRNVEIGEGAAVGRPRGVAEGIAVLGEGTRVAPGEIVAEAAMIKD